MTGAFTASETEQILALDATEQAGLVRAGELTAEDLLQVAIDRIEQLNPVLNAVVVRAYEPAWEAIRSLPTGPFTGVPYLLKDLAMEAAGLPLHEGSVFLRDYASTRDSTLVVRLRAAGLVILGRTGSPEFGMKPTVETQLYGATHNPWDLTRSTGGSSGGSAAAVTSRMVPMAGANDAGGSIRIPASACGLFGLKPTRARTPYGPHYGDVFGGGCVEHAVTRSVRDSAALLDATAGPSPGDPYPAPPQQLPYAVEITRPVERLRIAFTATPADGRTADPRCIAAVMDTVGLLTELGHDVFERDLTELTPEVGAAIGTMYGAGTDWAIKYWIRQLGREPTEEELDPFTRALWGHGKQVSGGDYLMAQTTLQSFTRRVAEAMADFDLWLSPTLGTLPPKLGTMASTQDDPWRGNEVAADLVSFPLVTANVTGNPAMSVPLNWTDGLPVGSHFMAGFGREDVLFRLASQLEQARPWGQRRPTLPA